MYKLNLYGINYTIGLILFDPLVKEEELLESLSFFQKNCLIQNIASPLKELRIYKQGKYYSQFSDSIKSSDKKHNDEALLSYYSYNDQRIEKSIAYIRKINNIIAGSGYRHSDVAAFEALSGIALDNRLSLPKLISFFEIKFLESILSFSTKEL